MCPVINTADVFFTVDSCRQVRLFRMGRILKKLDKLPGADSIKILQLIFGFLLVANIVGCVFYSVGTMADNLEDAPGVHMVGNGLPIFIFYEVPTDWLSLYMASLYYSLIR